MTFLRTSRMDLMERLAMHLGYEVALQAEGFASEPGVLQKIGTRFIRVNGVHFVPYNMQEIVLLGRTGPRTGNRASIRTLYAGAFEAELLRTGQDFMELRVTRPEEEEDLGLLIPLKQIIGAEPL